MIKIFSIKSHRGNFASLHKWLYPLLALIVGCNPINLEQKPVDFVYLSDVDPTIIENPRYFNPSNFTGRPVPGYTYPRITCTRDAAMALANAHAELKEKGYRLVVYDGYRPQRSVNAFMKWSGDMNDQAVKHLYYPTIDKRDLFNLGYVAERSSHSRGSTFDLTIIPIGNHVKPLTTTHRPLKNGELIPFIDDGTVDMGSSFDLFHKASHHDSPVIQEQYLQRRNFLRNIMKKNGFKHYQLEWWHYTLENEPYPDTYFNFIS